MVDLFMALKKKITMIIILIKDRIIKIFLRKFNKAWDFL